MHRARALAAEHRKGAGEDAGQLRRVQQRMAEGGNPRDKVLLRAQFMQTPLLHPQLITGVDGRDHQHRH